MAGLPSSRKLAIASRVARTALNRHPYFAAVTSAAGAVARSLVRAFRQLWLEISGFFFLVFAVLGGFAAYREYPALQAGEGNLGRLMVICLFTAVFLWFGVSSLWRARRKT